MTGQHIPDAIRLGQQVRQRRAALDLTAFTLAQLADVDLTTVNDIETGCPATKQKTAHVITALGCTPTDDGITPVLTEHTTKAIAVAVNRLKGDRHTAAVRWYRTAVPAHGAPTRARRPTGQRNRFPAPTGRVLDGDLAASLPPA